MAAVIFSSLFVTGFALRLSLPIFRERTMKSAAATAVCWLLAGTALASLISVATFDKGLSKYDALVGQTVTVEGTVTEVSWDAGYSGSYVVRATMIEGSELSDFLFLLDTQGGLCENDTIKAEVSFSDIESSPEFDAHTYYLSKKIFLKGEAESVAVTGEAGFSLTYGAKRLNSSLSRILTKSLSEEEGGFAATLLLGNKSNLSPTVKRDFSRLGISHILAISGMHITILCTMVSRLFSVFGKKAGQAACACTVIFYMLITGFSSSVTRSGLMLLLMMLASFAQRQSDRFTNLGLAAFIICIIDPFSCADVGLQLSFASVFAILLYSEGRNNSITNRSLFVLPPILQKTATALVDGIKITVIVVLFMLPLEWLYFGRISVISPLTSSFFSLLCTLLLWMLPVLIVLSPAPTFLFAAASLIKPLITFISSLSNDISQLRGINISIDYPFSPYFCAAVFICICGYCVSKKKPRLIFAGLCTVLIAAFAICSVIYTQPLRETAPITMLEHNKSDGLCIASDSRILLVDMGNGYSGIYKKGANAARNYGATEIEAILLTHIHSSHAQTLSSFFGSNMVRTLILPKEESSAFDSLEKLCRENRVQLITYEKSDTIEFENVLLRVSPSGYIKRSKQPIIRIDVVAHDSSFTYVGGAYLECFPGTELLADHVWFGTHGPLYKAEFTPLISENATVYASDAATQYLPEDFYTDPLKSLVLDGK
ncbi:MAG: ComEC/Rec2 family competence protein [Clostridia bacterium]|nr:ComEC/Rec2 family competence protein [Clostridia bacterium]